VSLAPLTFMDCTLPFETIVNYANLRRGSVGSIGSERITDSIQRMHLQSPIGALIDYSRFGKGTRL